MSAVVVRFPKFPAEVLLPRFPLLDRDSGSAAAEGFPGAPVLDQAFPAPVPVELQVNTTWSGRVQPKSSAIFRRVS